MIGQPQKPQKSQKPQKPTTRQTFAANGPWSGAMASIRRAFTVDVNKSERYVRELLRAADINVGGSRPHDIRVNNPEFYTRVLRDGSLGFGESYMDGQWDADVLDEALKRVLLAKLDVIARKNIPLVLHTAKAKLLNLQNKMRAFQVGEQHYDIGNELYTGMLDNSMAYTCAYWRDGARTLEEAQTAKLDLVCRKLNLKEGMRVLELGCGWGGFAKHAAENYGVSVVGFTVSKEQASFASEWTKHLPVEIRMQDYREARGTYDAVVSIGLMEHIGPKNYRSYMELVDRCLAPGGVALVHTIAGNRAVDIIEPWFEKYIFPNAVLPTIGNLSSAFDDLFVCEDVHNIGPDYDLTLMAWNRNFNEIWPTLSKQNPSKYNERFYRMWTFYLLCSAAGFRTRYTQLFQLVLTRAGTSQPNDVRRS